MLKELRDVRQIAGESIRRVFSDQDMDLTVWVDEGGGVTGFELCYDKGHLERAVRWNRENRFLHRKVDDGENRGYDHKETPILVPDGTFAAEKSSRLFYDNSRDIDTAVADFVHRMLVTYPE
ncbi:MAG: hypothetical protein ACYC7L_15635 [Nitrospirota bacterium]